jgi:hypothetical protein
VEREVERTRQPAEAVRQRIEAVAADCDHSELHRVGRPGNCKECGHSFSIYLCRGCACALEVCKWCLESRLWLHRVDGGRVPHQLADERKRFMLRSNLAILPRQQRMNTWLVFRARRQIDRVNARIVATAGDNQLQVGFQGSPSGQRRFTLDLMG